MTHGSLALATPVADPVPLAPIVAIAQDVDQAPRAALPEDVTPTPAPTSVVTLKEPRAAAESDGDPLAVFRGILRRVAESHPALASVFEHAAVRELTKTRAVLGFAAESFAGAQAKEPEALEVITRAVRAHFGAPTEVVLDLSAQRASGGTVAVAVAAERKQITEKAKAAAAGHPLVVEALRVFNAELVEVRLREEEELG
jgi:hypothetical protein